MSRPLSIGVNLHIRRFKCFTIRLFAVTCSFPFMADDENFFSTTNFSITVIYTVSNFTFNILSHLPTPPYSYYCLSDRKRIFLAVIPIPHCKISYSMTRRIYGKIESVIKIRKVNLSPVTS